jgi:hypothetical protein
MLAELRAERDQRAEAVLILQRLAASGGKRQRRPPAWMTVLKWRGMPPGEGTSRRAANPSLWRMTNLASGVPLRLRIRQTDRNLARRKVSASVAMILLARAGDVNGLSLWVLLGRFVLLCGNRECNRTKERYEDRERRKQALHRVPMALGCT